MRAASIPHVPALDGLRGAAVAGVVAFHYLGYTGGYLGVDLFFVLSGYLITSLLLAEHRSSDRISLGAFWARRARRLLPAVLLVLVAVAIYAKVAAPPSQLESLRLDGLATLFYVANWRAIASQASYWAMFTAPSPLQHTWSLAIEEQFYVVWPLVAWLVLRGRGRRAVDLLLGITVVALAASAVVALVSYRPDADPSRVYFGTDTRVAAILFGAALACVVVRFGRPSGRVAERAIEGAGWVGFVVLAVHWSVVDGQSPYLYRGGLLLCGLAATVVVFAATATRTGPLAQLFSLPPLRALGLVSYGVYLWHWPVLVVLSPERTGLDGVLLFLARCAATGAVTMLSYRLVEQPIRRGALRGWIGRVSAPAGIVTASVALVACTATPAVTGPPGGTVSAALGGGSAASTTLVGSPGGTGGESSVPGPSVPAPSVPGSSVSGSTDGGPTTPTTTARSPGAVIAAATASLGHPPKVLMVGDSVAFSLSASMIPVQDQLGVDIHSKAVIACGVARGTGRVLLQTGDYATEAAECHAWPDRWRAELESFRPDIALLVLGWPGNTARELEGEYRKPCDPVFDRWYEGEVHEALDVLRSTGVRVAMTSVPYYRSERAPAGTDDVTDCINATYRKVLDAENAAAVASGRIERQVATVDLAHYVCPEGRTCRTEVEGITMRVDGLHYDGDPGVIVGAWVIAQALSATDLG